jgi:hypothetical protein
MALLPIYIQLIALWSRASDCIANGARTLRDDERGELTGGVILLVALALVAATVAGIIVAKIQSEAGKL